MAKYNLDISRIMQSGWSRTSWEITHKLEFSLTEDLRWEVKHHKNYIFRLRLEKSNDKNSRKYEIRKFGALFSQI